MPEAYPVATLSTSPQTANRIVWIISGIIFAAVAILSRVQVPAPDGFDVHLFAKANAVINSLVSLLLVVGLVSVKAKKWHLHRRAMMAAMGLSVLFLMSYILHHLFAGDTKFGGQGWIRPVYYCILISHILLAAGSLPFILLTAYRALAGNFSDHARIAKRVWPIWFYVSLSGVIVYFMISPYY